MPLPIIAAGAAAVAARLAAKKLAQEAAKKATRTAAIKASAKVAKKVPPKMNGQTIKINSNPVKPKKVVNPILISPKKLSPSAEKSIAEARKALGTTKPDPKALARKITQDKAREAARIRKQGRNTR
jgi:hypothetical protein